MDLTKKIAAAAGALTLAGAGIAAAVEPPEAADQGLTTAEEQVGVDLPASKDAHPGGEDATETEDTETEDATEVETESEGTGPVDNHGAIVSAVAHMEFETGREHGEAVSTVARTNGGAEDSAAAGTDDAETDDAETDDAETDDAETGNAGGGASGDHGRP